MSASAGNADFVRAMVPVAIAILGEPNKEMSNRDEVRWGGRGSFCVDVKKGTWCDHENGDEGGGCLDFVMQRKRLKKPEAVQWLQDQRYLPDNGPIGKRIVKTYDYHDADGALVFQVVRYEPKNFLQRRPDPSAAGGWTWKTSGMLLPLYRFPELRQAVDDDKLIFIAEGEKSVDALIMLGLAATCSPGGAGKWHDYHSLELLGADIVILPDNDDAGRDHAAKVRTSLGDRPKRIRTLALPNLPDKGDAFDWIAAGGTAETLRMLTDNTQEQSAAAKDKSSGLYLLTPAECIIAPMRSYIVKGLLARGDHGAIIGLPGSGKSILAPYVGYRASLGLDVFGHRTKPVTVLYLAAEDGTGMTMRVRALHDRMGNSPTFLLQPVPVDLLTPGGTHTADVEKLIQDHQPGLVILDTVARAFPGLRENDPDGMGHVVKVARGFAAICNSAVVSIHHPPKAGEKTPRGHSNYHGDLDMTLYLEGAGRDPRHVTMGKNRNGASDLYFSFNLGVQDFGRDEDGDLITAPVAEPAEGPGRPKTRLTATERNAVTFLADLLCDEGKPLPHQPGFPNRLHGVDEGRWREECERRRLSTADTPKDRSRVFRKVSGDLRNKGAVGMCDGLVWLTSPDEGG